MKYRRSVAVATVFISTVVFIYVVVSFANKSYPLVGHDYGYFVPRLLDSYLHYKINGLSIQWYTPSFGSGLPAYPNPQHVQFTLDELLMVFVDPWQAIWISTSAFILVGSISAFLLFEKIFGFDPFASALGSLIFNLNGFVFSHAVVGHLGYQLFPLLSLVFLGLFYPTKKLIYKSVLLAIIITLNLHTGGFYVIVIYVLSMMMAVPILIILRPKIFNWDEIWKTLLLTILIAFLFSGSKLYAVISFLHWFPRNIADHYPVSLPVGLYGIFLQLFGSLIFLTSQSFMGLADVNEYVKLTRFTHGSYYGLWEFDTGISPATLILVGFSLVSYIFYRKAGMPVLKTILLIVLSLCGVWLTTEFRLTSGLLYPLIRQLPLVESLHVNIRFTAAYFLPLSILAALGFIELQLRLKSEVYIVCAFLFFSVITLLSFAAYSSFPTFPYKFSFDISQANTVYQNIKHGESYVIESNDSKILDMDVFQNHASSLTPYEPIFGYQLEDFHPLTRPGPVSEITDNHFNMTNPASLVFPEENSLYPFQRIGTDEKDKFEQFVNHKQPDWKVPAIQVILDNVMIWSLILTPLFLVIYGGIVGRKTPKMDDNL